ncbi:MAG: LytTR family transcriptional regulator [Muribaculaceae bacterium]|nr:LytTR family transcriptional regulator [Muribaculaceae bacterium]
MEQTRHIQHQLPRKFFKLTAQVIYIVVLPLFFLLFALSYRPESLVRLLDMGREMFSFNLTMVFAIIFGSYLTLRLSLYFLRHKISHHPLWYTAWCIMEAVFVSFFVALYLWLMYNSKEMPFYTALGNSLVQVSSILLYPYLIVFLLQLVEANVKFKQRHLAEMKKAESVNDNRIKFTDENGQVRFTSLPQDILYLESDGNYVRIHYLSRNEKKIFSLRNAMKNVEAKCEEFSFVRCHRSYIINPKRVKLLTKSEDGTLYAELNDVQSTHVPITKTYYDALTEIL